MVRYGARGGRLGRRARNRGVSRRERFYLCTTRTDAESLTWTILMREESVAGVGSLSLSLSLSADSPSSSGSSIRR